MESTGTAGDVRAADQCEAWRAAGATDGYSPVLTELAGDLADCFVVLRGDAGRLRALAGGVELCPWIERHQVYSALW